MYIGMPSTRPRGAGSGQAEKQRISISQKKERSLALDLSAFLWFINNDFLWLSAGRDEMLCTSDLSPAFTVDQLVLTVESILCHNRQSQSQQLEEHEPMPDRPT